MAAILRDSVAVVMFVAVVVVVRTHPRAIPLGMIVTRKSSHEFPLLSYMGMGLRSPELGCDSYSMNYCGSATITK